MNAEPILASSPKAYQWPERIFLVSVLFTLAALAPVAILLDSPFPIFTVIWLVVPLIAVARSHSALRVGWHMVAARELVKVTCICLTAMFLLCAVVEPRFHAYQLLLHLATSSPQPDSTFAWVVRFPGIPGLLGMLAYSGLVTIMAEELFFRGWLLQFLLRRMDRTRAVVLQASLFALPQLLPALLMPTEQGIVYVAVYSWLIIGLVGGWAAARTSSILPSLVSATILNFVLAAILL